MADERIGGQCVHLATSTHQAATTSVDLHHEEAQNSTHSCAFLKMPIKSQVGTQVAVDSVDKAQTECTQGYPDIVSELASNK